MYLAGAEGVEGDEAKADLIATDLPIRGFELAGGSSLKDFDAPGQGSCAVAVG